MLISTWQFCQKWKNSLEVKGFKTAVKLTLYSPKVQWNLDFYEPLHNEVLGIINDIFQLSNGVIYGKEPRFNKPLI